MHLENRIRIAASPDIIFRLASDVERWPERLPHYRYVRVLNRDGGRLLVRMSAFRDGIPVAWTSILEPMAVERRIRFRHVGGITRGMEVEWQLEPLPDGATGVSIVHDFEPGWPVVGGRVARFVIGELFVRNIAGKTLRRFKELAEAAGVESA